MATSRLVQPSVRRVTCSSASKTPADADLTGPRARSDVFSCSQAALRDTPVRGFCCVPLSKTKPKTKDVPCSKRS
jgi:hypothetical protein